MKNPIEKFKLCATPHSAEKLTWCLDSMSNRAEAWQVMMLTMNYCHKLVQENIEVLEKETPKRKVLAKRAAASE